MPNRHLDVQTLQIYKHYRYTNITEFDEINDLKLQILTVEFKALEKVARISTIRRASLTKKKKDSDSEGEGEMNSEAIPSKVPSGMEFFM